MAELDVMPGMDKLPSINPDFDVNALPDFDDEMPKKKKNKQDKNASKKSKSKKKSNTSSSSNSSYKSESNSKLKSTSKQTSYNRTSSKKKQKKSKQPRKISSIRDRIKQYDSITKKANEEMKNSSLKKTSQTKENTNKKSKDNTDKKSKKKGSKKDTNSKTKKTNSENTSKPKKHTDETSKPTTDTNEKKQENDNSNVPPPISQEPALIKQIAYSPVTSKTDSAEMYFNFDEKKAEINEKVVASEAPMLESISPIHSEHLESTALYSTDTMDTVKTHDSDSDLETGTSAVTETKSAVDELLSENVSTDAPQAYQMKALDLEPETMSKDVSFEAMYEPAYRHEPVKFKTLKSGTSNYGSDGDLMRDVIKQKIAKNEEKRAKLKRKQSKTTAFDKRHVSGANLWGRKMNTFGIKNGQQMIVEWRFVTSDNKSHTLVLQHEQIKKKKKSKRMIILDGNEKYCQKAKKMEFKINVDECMDVLNIGIECVDEKAMKYNYRLKINNVAYSAVFHKWLQANK